jgi:glycosyltransferase involved in cell wall biosynthesis
VSGYYYLQGKLRYSRFVCPILTAGKDDGEDLRWTPWVPPLVTNSTGSGLGANEIDNTRLLFERVLRLVAESGTPEEERRERDDPMEAKSPLGSSESRENETEGRESSTAGAESRRDATNAGCQESDDRLVSRVQADYGLRRAASDLVQALQRAPPRDPTGRQLRRQALCRQLRRVYPRLLELPSPPSHTFQYEISLIVPYYDPESAYSSKPIGSFLDPREKERGLRLQEERPAAETAARRLLQGTIEHARVRCDDPGSVELVVVHSCDDFDGDANDHQDADCDEKDSTSAFLNGPGGANIHDISPSPRPNNDWGSVVLRVVGNRGRGPCLNEGARRASGRVLAFCHADAKLPAGWDSSIRAAFGGGGGPSTNNGEAVLATAFQFGVDQEDRPPIPGLQAVVATANWRSRWFSLPYGDQCIGMRADVFRHVGGFPDLPLMEDYELVRCLRARELAARGGETRQRIVILPAQVRCSPRRWERYGVPFVTITNSRLVWAYQSGRASAAEIYERYYGAPCGGGGGSASSRQAEREKD